LQHRRAEAAGTDDQHARRLQLLLPRPADFRQQDMALAYAGDFFGLKVPWLDATISKGESGISPENLAVGNGEELRPVAKR
jgi:hypothetical protein